MKFDEAQEGAAAKAEAWDTVSHANFYSYYEHQSLSEKTMERFRLITEALLRLLESRQEARTPDALDVGCGAGAQSKFLARVRPPPSWYRHQPAADRPGVRVTT